MKKFCLARGVILFYTATLPFIVTASFYNLFTIVNGQRDLIGFGAFALAGFILLPLAIVSTYKSHLCCLEEGQIRIGEKIYPFDAYTFELVDTVLPLYSRPLYSMHKRTYQQLVIKQEGEEFGRIAVDTSKRNVEALRTHLP